MLLPSDEIMLNETIVTVYRVFKEGFVTTCKWSRTILEVQSHKGRIHWHNKQRIEKTRQNKYDVLALTDMTHLDYRTIKTIRIVIAMMLSYALWWVGLWYLSILKWYYLQLLTNDESSYFPSLKSTILYKLNVKCK